MRTACTRLAALLLVTVLVASCGGGSKDTAGSDSGSAAKTTQPAPDDTAAEDTGAGDTGSADTGSADTGSEAGGGRPDGQWLLVETDEQAAPAELAVLDTSYLRLVTFTPSCDSGPCKVTMKRLTDTGDVIPDDYPESDDGSTAADRKPGPSSYHDGTYSISYSGDTTCTKLDGTFGTTSGEARFTTTYEFTYDDEGASPTVDGTSTTTYETTDQGVAAGCAPEDHGKITSRLQGVPLDTVTDAAGADITGDWISTGRVQDADDYSSKQLGGRGALLKPVKWAITSGCTGSDCDATVKFPEISADLSLDLKQDGDHWTGTHESVGDCSKNGTTEVILKGGYNNTEEYDFTSAAAADGKSTILLGHYKSTGTPTPEAVALSPVDCFPQHVDSYIVVVRPS